MPKQRKKILLFALLLLLSIGYFHNRLEHPASQLQTEQDRAIQYLGEVAFGSEFGSNNKNLIKLSSPIRLYVEGYTKSEDESFIQQFLATLGTKVPALKPELIQDKNKANILVYYVPLDQLKEFIPNYIHGNWGFFDSTDRNYQIQKINIGVASDVSNQLERNHLFMEELIGALGLGKDSMRYPDSILYQEWTTVQEPNALDWLCLQLYYADYVKPGMDFQQMKNAILQNTR